LHKFLFIVLLGALIPAAGCGGGSNSTPGNNSIAPPAQNVQAVAVNSGPTGNYLNGLFTSVTVCLPANASDCQTVNDVLVDTGSVGLRVLASAMTLPLPQQTTGSASPIAECNQFQDGYTWGPVKIANIKIAGEQANSVPVQVIGDPAFSSVPTSCTNTGLVSEDTLQSLGANGCWESVLSGRIVVLPAPPAARRIRGFIMFAPVQAASRRRKLLRHSCRIQSGCFPRTTMA